MAGRADSSRARLPTLFDTEGRPPPGGYAAPGGPPSSHSNATTPSRVSFCSQSLPQHQRGPVGGCRLLLGENSHTRTGGLVVSCAQVRRFSVSARCCLLNRCEAANAIRVLFYHRSTPAPRPLCRRRRPYACSARGRRSNDLIDARAGLARGPSRLDCAGAGRLRRPFGHGLAVLSSSGAGLFSRLCAEGHELVRDRGAVYQAEEVGLLDVTRQSC